MNVMLMTVKVKAKITEIIKYKLCLIVKAISLSIAYLSLLLILVILQHTFLNNYLSLADKFFYGNELLRMAE